MKKIGFKIGASNNVLFRGGKHCEKVFLYKNCPQIAADVEMV